jgi:hypothetical protein
MRTPEEQLWHSHHTVHIRQAYQNILKRQTLRVFNDLSEFSEIIYYDIIFNYNVFATIKFLSIITNIIF